MDTTEKRTVTDEPAAKSAPRLSTLDAVLLAPLAAPFVLPPLAVGIWGLARLASRYVERVQAPPAPAAWWEWPWGWPGARVVEALHVAMGLPAAPDLFHFDRSPWHLVPWTNAAGRAFMALSVDCLVALMPAVAASWAIAGLLALARRRMPR